jgi:dihydropteroate synthase type 2
MPPRILGILNVTRDSYSDGGRYLDPQAAIEHGRQLLREGAARIDIGAESTHPDAEDVSEEEQLRRLEPVLGALVADGAEVSVDTSEPEVMRRALELGARCINDVRALREPGALAAVAPGRCELILMHSTATGARAERREHRPGDWIARIAAFFEERIGACERAGIARERLILDPGLGFFLSSDPAPSLEVLRRVRELRELGLPLCLSPSRKSFLGAVLGRGVGERDAGSLACELWCARQGVDWIRTHSVGALADALRIVAALEQG